jgi:hypothetical protein
MGAQTGQVVSFADGVWVSSSPVVYLGMRLTATMTVLRLGGGGLLLHSPVPLTPERRGAVEALGPVAHLYAPNLFHDRWIDEWAGAFPAARVHAPPGLTKKHRGLRVDRVQGASEEPAFSGAVDEIPIKGFRLRETVLLYRPARTLVVADLVHNVGRPTHGWTATYARTMGFYDRVALSRVIRWTGFDDRGAARASVDDVLGRGFDRLIVGHGEPLAAGARDAVANAYGWLRG